MGPGHFFVAPVGSSLVSHLYLWKFFPKKIAKFFNFFLFQVKKISSGQVKKYLGQRQAGPVFTAGQKYAWIKSIFCCSSRVGSPIFGLGLENFPLKSQNFQFFSP